MFRFRNRPEANDASLRVEPPYREGEPGKPGANTRKGDRRWDDRHERATALPEVREGNSEADWALWERAVRELDQQVQARRRERAEAADGGEWEQWLRGKAK